MMRLEYPYQKLQKFLWKKPLSQAQLRKNEDRMGFNAVEIA
jgi:hypothetical protein